MSDETRNPADPPSRETQRRLEHDLRMFCITNANKYADFYRDHYEYSEAFGMRPVGSFGWSWHWPAFFVPLPWLLYRKQWLLALALFVVSSALSLVGSETFVLVIGFVLAIALAASAKCLYVDYAIRKIRKVRTHDVPVREWDAYLQAVGGVSFLGGAIGTIYYLFVALSAVANALITVPR